MRALSLLNTSWRTIGPLVDTAALVACLSGAMTGAGGSPYRGFAVAYGICVLGTSWIRRDHARRLQSGLIDIAARALYTCSLAFLLVLASTALVGASNPAISGIALWGLVSLSVGAARVLIRLVEARAQARGAFVTPTLVVGAGVIGAQVARRLVERPELGLRPAGFLDSDPMPHGVQLPPGVPVLGGPEDLEEAARATGARHVILAFSSERDHTLIELVKRCQRLGFEVCVVPRLYESVNRLAKLEHLGGLPLLELRAIDTRSWQFTAKYVLDRVFAAVMLLSVAPLMLAIAVAVRLSSPGPVVFRQRRVGRDGREFDLFKFRTMKIEPRPVAEALPAFSLPMGVAPGGVEGEDRRTAVGRWLRNTSLDELPQLLNVLRGEMSMVGPRPERPEFAARFSQEITRYDDRHQVKSGITGWAQVNGLRGQTSIADRVEWDNHYILNWSVGLELRTLAMTIAAVFRFREDEPGASRQAGQPQAASNTTQDGVPLRLVSSAPDEQTTRWFCGYCGDSPTNNATPAPVARVCGSCGVGLMLETSADVVPSSGEAFLVVDDHLTVQALSQQAEQLLGTTEPEATNRPVHDFLVGANAECPDEASFANALLEAPATGEPPRSIVVRPRDTFGVRIHARIGSCGPPRAVLIVLESGDGDRPRERKLRLVEPTLAAAKQA